jgi:hypothetical protein
MKQKPHIFYKNKQLINTLNSVLSFSLSNLVKTIFDLTSEFSKNHSPKYLIQIHVNDLTGLLEDFKKLNVSCNHTRITLAEYIKITETNSCFVYLLEFSTKIELEKMQNILSKNFSSILLIFNNNKPYWWNQVYSLLKKTPLNVFFKLNSLFLSFLKKKTGTRHVAIY